MSEIALIDAEGRKVPSATAQAAHAAFHEAWGGPAQSLNLYVDSPIWERVAEAVRAVASPGESE